MRYVDYQEARDMTMSSENLLLVIQNSLFSWARSDADMDEGSLMGYYKIERNELLQLLKERL